MPIRVQLYRCLGWAITEDKPIAPELSQWCVRLTGWCGVDADLVCAARCRYANVIKTFCLGLVYGPLSPAVYPLSVISFIILQYQVHMWRPRGTLCCYC